MVNMMMKISEWGWKHHDSFVLIMTGFVIGIYFAKVI